LEDHEKDGTDQPDPVPSRGPERTPRVFAP